MNVGYQSHRICSLKGEFKPLNQNTHYLMYQNGKKLREINILNQNQLTYILKKKALYATHSKKNNFYFVLFEDWQIHILNDQMKSIYNFAYMTVFPIGLHFCDQSQSLLIFSNSKVEQLFFDVKDSQYIPSGKKIFANSQFIRGYKVWKKDFYFVWEQTLLKVFDQEAQLICQRKTHITSFITSLIYYEQLEYIICGCNDGNIYTWSLFSDCNHLNVFETQSIHPINQICLQEKSNNFLAYYDTQIAVFNIQNWQMVAKYQLNQNIKNLIIINHKLLIAASEDSLFLLQKQLELKQIYINSSELMQVLIEPTQFVFENNQILLFNEQQEINTIYIATKQTILKSYFKANIYYFLTEKGNILQMIDEKVSLKVDKDKFFDDSGFRVNKPIIDLCFFNDKVLLSIQDGQILVASITDFHKIEFQLNHNRFSIALMATNDVQLATFDIQNNLKIVSIVNNQTTILLNIQTNDAIQQIQFQNPYFILLINCTLHIFREFKATNYDQEEYLISNFKLHDSVIFTQSLESILIMTYEKALIIQINIEQPILGFGFTKISLIICHSEEIVSIDYPSNVTSKMQSQQSNSIVNTYDINILQKQNRKQVVQYKYKDSVVKIKESIQKQQQSEIEKQQHQQQQQQQQQKIQLVQEYQIPKCKIERRRFKSESIPLYSEQKPKGRPMTVDNINQFNLSQQSFTSQKVYRNTQISFTNQLCRTAIPQKIKKVSLQENRNSGLDGIQL